MLLQTNRSEKKICDVNKLKTDQFFTSIYHFSFSLQLMICPILDFCTLVGVEVFNVFFVELSSETGNLEILQ